jgi:hypothetical protein
MLILQVVRLTERALLVLVIFLDLLLFAGLLKNNLQLPKSITEAEYVVTASCCSQILWIVHTMRDFGVIFERIPLMCNNTNDIPIAKNIVFHKRMIHLERRHHFLRDHVEKGDIEMRYIDTERQIADIFTKPLDSSHFAALWGGGIGVCHTYGLI